MVKEHMRTTSGLISRRGKHSKATTVAGVAGMKRTDKTSALIGAEQGKFSRFRGSTALESCLAPSP